VNAYLHKAEQPNYAADDPLFQQSVSREHPWIIDVQDIQQHQQLDAIFSGRLNVNSHANLGTIRLSADDSWLKTMARDTPAFQNLASTCEHFLLPLLLPENRENARYEALGFVIVDNPYAASITANLHYTTFICDMLATQISDRTYLNRKAEDALRRYEQSAEVQKEVAERAQRMLGRMRNRLQ
jgi:hypothetical protein